ncbi:MAG: VCBS repeat-containing protein, partial [Acidobacteria bacterium]|nr:VCBS repeat-containing protein [Acidobacteriota bacterium]
MRILPIAKTRQPSRMLPFALAILTALALVSLVTGPSFIASAQDAANAPQAPSVYRTPYDFTGDGRSDFANFTTAAGLPITWRILRNPADPAPGAAFIRIFDFGTNGDSLTPGDYLGDSKCDVSVWRTGQFITAPFPEGTGPIGPVTFDNWGLTTAENPGRVGDYDGDGKDDEVIVRVQSSVLTWYIKKSSGGTLATPFGRVVTGFNTLAFQGADFNGDGKDDLVMANANTNTGANTWWVGDATTGQVILSGSFGNFITDYFVGPDDYTGDGKADLVVYRAGGADADAGGWYIRDTATGNVSLTIFGVADPNFTNEDIPVRGNFDGDNKADITVFRRATK